MLGELKYRKQGQEIGDDNQELVIQLANYVREAFGYQPGRRFIHAFTFINERMCCWVFTRSGGIGSPLFRPNCTEGIQTFRRVFWGYLNNQGLGLAGVQNIMHHRPSLADISVYICRNHFFVHQRSSLGQQPVGMQQRPHLPTRRPTLVIHGY